MRAISIFVLSALAASADDSLVKGLEAFHAGRYTEARPLFENSKDPEARTFLALTQAATGGCKHALPQLTTAFTTAADTTLRKLAGEALMSCVEASLKADYPADADVL